MSFGLDDVDDVFRSMKRHLPMLFNIVPTGMYVVEIVDVLMETHKSRGPILRIIMEIIEGDQIGKLVSYDVVLYSKSGKPNSSSLTALAIILHILEVDVPTVSDLFTPQGNNKIIGVKASITFGYIPRPFGPPMPRVSVRGRVW